MAAWAGKAGVFCLEPLDPPVSHLNANASRRCDSSSAIHSQITHKKIKEKQRRGAPSRLYSRRRGRVGVSKVFEIDEGGGGRGGRRRRRQGG